MQVPKAQGAMRRGAWTGGFKGAGKTGNSHRADMGQRRDMRGAGPDFTTENQEG